MFYKNARIFCADFQFRVGAFEVIDGRFGAILPQYVPVDAIDLQGATVIPGLIDSHIHGSVMADVIDCDFQGLMRMARYLAQNGITSFVPTTVTMDYETLEKAFINVKKLHKQLPFGHARPLGIHMEGPYFSSQKKGGQHPAFLREPDLAGFRKLFDGCSGFIAIVDIAPELSGAIDFIREASKLCTVSVAHSNTDYEIAKAAFAAGATQLTHLFNGMPGIHHRNPSVIPAAAENPNVRAELICDGIHVHPACIRLAFSIFGSDRMVLVSDCLRACGMPDGEYSVGGLQAYVSNGVGRLPDGTITGAVTNLFQGMRNAMLFGIPESDAISAATYNPACALNMQDKLGSISTGHIADFVICQNNYTDIRVIQDGIEL